MGSTAVVIVKNNSGFCERPARKILIIIIEMGNCCDNKAKVPSPYQFLFNSRDKLAENEQHFEQNSIKTSKYNIASFVPLALVQQFKRLANIYFLIIAILQTIPIVSPLSPITAWAPLIVVILISMAREGYEDYQRYKSDKQLNFESSTKVRRDNKFQTVPWSEVVVGDIVMVEEGEMFPADLILLASSIEGGNAYIETASLDGQKNLKPRVAPKESSPYGEELKLPTLEGECACAQPDKDLHNFQASLIIRGISKKIVIEGDKQLMYRGAKLKNTKWIIGLTVYTGRVTKIMLNSESTADKMSQIEVKVNTLLIFIFLFQLVLCLVCALAYGLTQSQYTPHWYINPDENLALSSFIISLSYLVLFNTMIPISLIVSLEIVKTIQGIFIQKDQLLFNQKRKKGVQVFSSTLNEELGQIEYVFTDKTGTLTCNIMEFKIAVIGEEMFGDRSILGDNVEVQDFKSQTEPKPNMKGYYDENLSKLIKDSGSDMKLTKPYQIKSVDNRASFTIKSLKELSEQYLLLLATAHECVVEQDKEKNLIYQGPSPDEITLVDAAKNMGFVYRRTDNQYIYVQVKGREERFEILSVHPFTSDRKRMSVIIKQNGVIKMFIKGADSIIKKRLAPDQMFMDILDRYLNTFSVKGLRTLLVGEKLLSQQEYDEFKQAENRLPEEGRGKLRDELISKLENGFYLLGATAVLDRLQDNVPETIRDMLRANIKVWMLTGDKMETAQNIAMSCNLIQSNFKVVKYIPKSANHVQQLTLVSQQADAYRRSGIKKAFLVQGQHLGKLMQIEQCCVILAQMAAHCEAVVCCRLLPSQKADVVMLVRKHLNKITLSIGDGSNDVPMIKKAHIGVGLYGQEGMGAVQASDYALPEFQGLWRLLLVHGRWNYIRIAEMILYFFYKNMVFTIPQFYYAFFCAFSGQSFFDDMFISLYNIVFTAVPLIVRAVLEQDVYYIYKKDGTEEQHNLKDLPEGFEQRQTLKLLYPKIYYVGQENTIFNYVNFMWWILEALCSGLLITLINIYVLGATSINQNGYSSNMWLASVSSFSCIILVVSFKIATHTRFWSWLMFVSLTALSICLYIAYMWIAEITSNVKGTITQVYSTFETYLCVFFCVGVLLLLDGVLVFVGFKKGGYASKMRKVVDEDMISKKPYYEELSIKISENLNPHGHL